MTCLLDPAIFDDLFHGCALSAFVEVACVKKAPPCPNETRVRAYRYYEAALAEKNQSPREAL